MLRVHRFPVCLSFGWSCDPRNILPASIPRFQRIETNANIAPVFFCYSWPVASFTLTTASRRIGPLLEIEPQSSRSQHRLHSARRECPCIHACRVSVLRLVAAGAAPIARKHADRAKQTKPKSQRQVNWQKYSRCHVSRDVKAYIILLEAHLHRRGFPRSRIHVFSWKPECWNQIRGYVERLNASVHTAMIGKRARHFSVTGGETTFE